MKNKKNILIISILLSFVLSSCSTEQNYTQTLEETLVSSETIYKTDPVQTTINSTIDKTAIKNEPPYTIAENKEEMTGELEILEKIRDKLQISETHNKIEKKIYENFIDAYYLLVYGGNFEWNKDYEFLETYSGKTVKEYIKKYSDLFTKDFCKKLLNLYGNESDDGTALYLYMNFEDSQYFQKDSEKNYSIHFDDLTNTDQYKKYGFVQIGGTRDKGSDLTCNGHELRIISKTDREIIIENTVWHRFPYDIAGIGHPDYNCHLENGLLIIDSKWSEQGQFISAGELTGTVKEVPVISAYDTETERPDEYLEKFQYHVILEDGQWKFDNLELWG